MIWNLLSLRSKKRYLDIFRCEGGPRLFFKKDKFCVEEVQEAVEKTCDSMDSPETK